MSANSDFSVVSTTVENEDQASALARHIVESKLAACVQYMPIKSVYCWKGAVESAQEYLLLAKTRASLANQLMDYIKSAHSYDVPEIIATPISGGSRSYLDWILSVTDPNT